MKKEKFIPANQRMGWVKIAWTYGFIYLKQQKTDYQKIIKEIISKRGDTDTNACIVGGLIGSAIGLQNLNAEYITKMLNCDMKLSHHPRNPFFNPENGLILGNQLYDITPKILNIIPK